MEPFKEYYKMSHISAMKWQSTKSLFAKLEGCFYNIDVKKIAAESRTLITINLTLCIILQFEWQLQSQSLSQQLSWRSQLERYINKRMLYKEKGKE